MFNNGISITPIRCSKKNSLDDIKLYFSYTFFTIVRWFKQQWRKNFLWKLLHANISIKENEIFFCSRRPCCYSLLSSFWGWKYSNYIFFSLRCSLLHNERSSRLNKPSKEVDDGLISPTQFSWFFFQFFIQLSLTNWHLGRSFKNCLEICSNLSFFTFLW